MSTWLVTGATSGIGRAVTEKLLDRGDRVAALVRRPEALEDLRGHGDRLWIASVDVTDTPALRDAVERAFRDLGRVDVVFSNAGSGAFGAGEELSDDTVEQQIALNMVAPIQLIRAVLPHLREQGGGRIIQTSTMGGQITTTGGSMYHASKWGIEGFTETIMGEVAAFGIGITLIEPGGVRTPFGAALSISPALPAYADTPVGRFRQLIEGAGDNLTGGALGDPQKVAQAIIEVAAQSPAPRRLVLGSDAYAAVHDALSTRLAELEAAKAISPTTDHPADV
ncbi:SDR family oxidoreductase [Tsukamurella soli]